MIPPTIERVAKTMAAAMILERSLLRVCLFATGRSVSPETTE